MAGIRVERAHARRIAFPGVLGVNGLDAHPMRDRGAGNGIRPEVPPAAASRTIHARRTECSSSSSDSTTAFAWF